MKKSYQSLEVAIVSVDEMPRLLEGSRVGTVKMNVEVDEYITIDNNVTFD